MVYLNNLTVLSGTSKYFSGPWQNKGPCSKGKQYQTRGCIEGTVNTSNRNSPCQEYEMERSIRC